MFSFNQLVPPFFYTVLDEASDAEDEKATSEKRYVKVHGVFVSVDVAEIVCQRGVSGCLAPDTLTIS